MGLKILIYESNSEVFVIIENNFSSSTSFIQWTLAVRPEILLTSTTVWPTVNSD
jgi:hypothetical protein